VGGGVWVLREGGGGGGVFSFFPYCGWGGWGETDIEHREERATIFFPDKEKEMKICCWTLL